ncbi:riboflavin synthase, alpha subunit [Solidesulfovibrio fructosivorans JJ]]|uniref:Riboflavin synthase n=1 Tax=Solidesulfovibrio fructosivorans JJ] TaxID=596151 RepID=E1JRT1_SOLFR|nr:riboflavin synthase [Solidesulfovibrio fructosivorans]EFL52700.1 riboflavin synthase, alpha subunit [Solidesulfovibrio fructosivorans JJ]]
MFTGLVMGLGRVAAMDARGDETRFRIQALFDLDNIVIGESIAVNGACLTVETAKDREFTAYASAETLSKSGLGKLKPGSQVNLERALALGDRLGGHLVSGHVDCLAAVESVTRLGQSVRYKITFPEEFSPFVVPKGSVALDGVSLTVNDCGDGFLTVNVIPSTQGATTIAAWKPGVSLNMETDMLGKYVLRMLGPWQEAKAGKASKITEGFLKQHGF